MTISEKKKIIDLRVLNEGLFANFLTGVVGFLLGKRSMNTVIKGKTEDIETLTKYLKAMKRSGKEKDALINKLVTMQASSSSIENLKRDFFNSTSIKLP